MENLLFVIFIMLGTTAVSQERNPATGTTDSRNNTTEYGSFENYAFILDGKVIPKESLVDYPEAKLYKIHPYGNIKLDGQTYRKTVYFRTQNNSTPAIPYADDPAWFINGKQVSPIDIRASQPEFYTEISKSKQDTVINGTKYKGAIHVDTDEDFFVGRIALSDILKKYNNYLPTGKVIVHWYNRLPSGANSSDIGMIIPNHFSLYYLNEEDLKTVKVDRVRFAEGDRYVIHLIDSRFIQRRAAIWINTNKALAIFENPFAIDTDYICYMPDLDTTTIGIFNSVEIMPKANDGEEDYLERLAATLMLPAKKSEKSLRLDSIKVNFVVTDLGLLANLESNSLNTSANAAILHAIKKNACAWSSGLQSGRLVYTNRKMSRS